MWKTLKNKKKIVWISWRFRKTETENHYYFEVANSQIRVAYFIMSNSVPSSSLWWYYLLCHRNVQKEVCKIIQFLRARHIHCHFLFSEIIFVRIGKISPRGMYLYCVWLKLHAKQCRVPNYSRKKKLVELLISTAKTRITVNEKFTSGERVTTGNYDYYYYYYYYDDFFLFCFSFFIHIITLFGFHYTENIKKTTQFLPSHVHYSYILGILVPCISYTRCYIKPFFFHFLSVYVFCSIFFVVFYIKTNVHKKVIIKILYNYHFS